MRGNMRNDMFGRMRSSIGVSPMESMLPSFMNISPMRNMMQMPEF